MYLLMKFESQHSPPERDRARFLFVRKIYAFFVLKYIKNELYDNICSDTAPLDATTSLLNVFKVIFMPI